MKKNTPKKGPTLRRRRLGTELKRCRELAGLTLTFVGDGADNMVHSYLLAGATAGMHIRVACPDGYLPKEDVVADADAIAATTGGSITIYTDPVEAVQQRVAVDMQRLGRAREVAEVGEERL